ncbi:MAG TPA: hypothetical protein PKD09_12830 [Aggregatilinea sp.]|uniref:hypothetical protein n=1 Tax=Aggregatilinea sp. TaxID=2806333 RepID=UPI002B8EA311|nr:hypothetical protein [Aggregatilinea sp.]HML22530.1 hypothetical protein [Aggregatilinea sp.]
MLLVPLLTAVLLLAAIIGVVVHALDYLHHHPELTRGTSPLAYQLCHLTLAQVVDRYQQVKPGLSPAAAIAWNAPDGQRYAVTPVGVESARSAHSSYRLPWERIGGVGIRMQPGFRFTDENRDGMADNQYTMDYSFHLLIVPLSGATMDVLIPLHDRAAAVDFVAHALAWAEQYGKRVNTFGFDKPPTAYRKRIAKF